MRRDLIRKIVITGVLSAISVLLGWTHWGFIPWFSGASLTIMHVPVIIGAILEGPVVGVSIGLIFGVFSMILATVGPTGIQDPIFANPLVSILPRLFIGPIAWLVWKAMQKWKVSGLIVSGIAGSLTNTVLVLGMIGLLKFLPWAALPLIALVNGLPEAAVSAIITLAVVAAVWRIQVGRRKGANLEG